MVTKILERLSAPIRGLHQAAYVLAALTLASQALALLRDRLFAATFGAGETLDLYYAAFRVPDLVFALVTSLVSAYILIPRLSGMTQDKARAFLSETSSFLLGFGGLICVGLAILMPWLLRLLYPSFASSALFNEFVFLSRMLLFQPILLGLSGILGSVTQVHRRFALFALSPVLYNLGIILGAIAFYPIWGLAGIGLGVIIGSIAYLLVNVPVVIKHGVFPRLVLPNVRHMLLVMRDSVPRSLALGVGSFTLLGLTVVAARLGEGAVAVFTFAINLESVPLALIGSSYAVAAFPALSEASSREQRTEFTNILSASARHIILWSLTALGLIVVLRAHLVRVILGAGAFDWNATRLTAALLAVLAIGLAAQGLALLFSRALYAARQSWRPLIYQLAGGAITLAVALSFFSSGGAAFAERFATLLRVGDVPGARVLGIALAAATGQICLALLSLVALRPVAPGLSRTLIRPVFDGILAALAGGVAAYGTLALAGGIAPLTTTFAVFAEGLAAGVVGIAVAAITLFIVENEEFRIVVTALSRRIPFRLAPSAKEPFQP